MLGGKLRGQRLPQVGLVEKVGIQPVPGIADEGETKQRRVAEPAARYSGGLGVQLVAVADVVVRVDASGRAFPFGEVNHPGLDRGASHLRDREVEKGETFSSHEVFFG